MAQFNWYINKQGIRGHKGDKGDQGFSPYFTEEVNTMNEYKLRVHNEFDSFVTDNLRGNKIQLVNPDGTYVKYDKETGNFYVDSADYATGEIYGQVRLATLADVDLFDSESVLTPDVLSDTLPRYLVNNDGNITITQGSDSRTEIKLGSELHNVDKIYKSDTVRYLTSEDVKQNTNNPVHTFTITSGDGIGVYYALSSNESQFKYDKNSQGFGRLSLSDSIANKINSSATQASVNALSSDLDTERTTRLNADNAINAELAAERSERQVQDAALQNQLGTKLTVDNIKAGDNVELVKSGNNVTINSRGGSNLKIYEGQNINFAYDTFNAIFSDGTLSLDDFIFDNTDYKFGLKQANSIDELVATRNSYYIETVNSNIGIYNCYYNIYGFTTPTSKIKFNLSASSAGTKVYAGNTYADLTEVTPSSGSTYRSIIIDMANDSRHIFKVENVLLSLDSYNIIYAINYNIYIPDVNKITINSTGSEGGAIIDDETVSTDKVFSSSRTSELVGEVGNDLQDLAQRVNDIESLKVPNVVIIGEPMIQNGQVSNLDQQNHLQFPWIIERKGRIFSCEFEFTTGADVTRQQNIIDSRCSVAVAVRNSRIVWALSSNGQTFDVESEVPMNIQPHTTYYCRLYKRAAGSNYGYTLTVGYNEDDAHVSNTITLQDFIYPTTMTIGSDGNSFDGVIDLNKWSLKIDNDLVWLGMDNVGQAVSANVSLSNINEAGVKVINDLIDTKLGIIEALVDDINGEVN